MEGVWLAHTQWTKWLCVHNADVVWLRVTALSAVEVQQQTFVFSNPNSFCLVKWQLPRPEVQVANYTGGCVSGPCGAKEQTVLLIHHVWHMDTSDKTHRP